MAKQLLPEAEQYTKQNHMRQLWRKFVRVMACIVVFCTTYALILPAITMEKELICEIEEHKHDENCYMQTTSRQITSLNCTYESLGVHTHTSDCTDAENTRICGLSDYLIHEHDASCADESGAVICTLPEISGHIHADACYHTAEVEPELVCGLEEAEPHNHDDICYDAEGALVCGLAETEGHTHSDACWQIPETEQALICGRDEAILHTHSDACYDTDGVQTCAQPVLEQHFHGESCFTTTEEPVDTESLTCGMKESEEHTHGARCYGTWMLTCDMEEHTHIEECYSTADATEAPTEAETIPEETNPDTSLTETEQADVNYVIALIDEMPSADEIDAKIEEFEAAEDYEGEEAWLTEVYQQVARVYYHYSNLSKAQQLSVTNADKLLELEYIWSVTTYSSVITSDAPTPTWYTSTKDFIELNLYDYVYGINTNYNSNKNYPGFQWNGGAYAKSNYKYPYEDADVGIPNYITDRNYIDSIDFGNSIITNYQYEGSNYVKSTTAMDIGKLYDNSGASSTGKINWLWYDGDDYATATNRPVGFSVQVTDSSGSTIYTQSIANTLKDGYPALADTANTSLAYLFGGTSDSYVIKKNTESIDGLFQRDPVTGQYSYNSRTNHAQYSNNFFTLYEEIITPNFITYPFGNFLPLNTISDTTQATQVGAFNESGGMKKYVDGIIADLDADIARDDDGNGTTADYGDTSRQQLKTMLREYQENWNWFPRTINGVSNNWNTLSPANAIRDYFWGDTSGDGDAPSSDLDFITQDHLDKMYNIDWDVATNFFFGMEMKMNFYQPKDGLTGEDTNKDGTPDYPMEFYFTGDDDVWVYIDDVLFLDLTGIHRHVGGKIDFVNGWVYYYELDVENGGDVSSTPYAQYSFAALFRAAGWSDAQIDAVLKPMNSAGNRPFKDYTTHSFNFYYMERGSGSSVCRLNFNFPLLRQNTLSVEKELTADADIKALGNPDFQFQVLNVDESGNKTNESFFKKFDSAGGQWAYSLYDVDGSVIQEVKVTEKNPDGTVKTLEVYNADKQLVRRETEDDAGNAVIENYGEVLTIDENGIFTLKAGQRAEFVGISENWGKYYVRELIDPAIVAQYGEIYVDGQASSHVDNITVGEQTFNGYDSPIMDMSNGSTRFLFNNHIDDAKLGDLSITKNLEATYSGDTSKTFLFSVTLDGEPLPAGTTYTVGSTTKTVVIEDGVSYVELKGGETALITNILAGTKFEVAEAAASASGYVVSYTVDGAAQESPASGTIGLNQTVTVVVKNSERGASVQIPVTKGYYKHGTYERVSYFNLVQVTDETGMETVGETMTDSFKVTNTGDGCVDTTKDALFTLNYLEKDIDFGESDTLVLYYRLTEDNTQLPGSTLPNYQVFVYEVTLTKATADGSMSAEITGMWSGTADINGVPTGDLTKLDSVSAATFMNTIYGPLTVTKQVDGSDAYKQRKFEFEIILNTTHHGGAPLPETLPAVITRADGSTQNTTVTLTPKPDSETSDNGGTRKSIMVTLSHNERITINQIPYNTTWSVTELDVAEDVQVTYEIYQGTTLISSVSTDGKTVGYVKVGSANEAKVVVTNKQVYVLPETGGPGTTCYTMAGLMLMLCSAAYLLYRFKKRGREVV